MTRGNRGLKYSDAKEMVKHALEKGLSVFLWGHPGVGKSTMARELADEMGLPLIDIRLAQSDPTEIGGILYPDREKGESVWLKPSWIPDSKPAFIFLDEINAAVTKLHQSIAYQIVLEKRLRGWSFAKGTVVLAAGNLEEDSSIVQSLSQALSNRFVHYELKVDVDEWLKWAARAGIVEPIRGYIKFRGEESLYNNTGERAFPSPRSWEFASRLIEDEIKKDRPSTSRIKKLMESAIGRMETNGFIAFFKHYRNIDIEAFIFRGDVPKISGVTDLSFLHAVLSALANYYSRNYLIIKKEPFNNIVKFFMQKAVTDEHKIIFLNMLSNEALKDFASRRDAGKILGNVSRIVSRILAERIKEY